MYLSKGHAIGELLAHGWRHAAAVIYPRSKVGMVILQRGAVTKVRSSLEHPNIGHHRENGTTPPTSVRLTETFLTCCADFTLQAIWRGVSPWPNYPNTREPKEKRKVPN